MTVKHAGKFGMFDVYTDDECPRDEITIYSYGRIFVAPNGEKKFSGDVVKLRNVGEGKPDSEAKPTTPGKYTCACTDEYGPCAYHQELGTDPVERVQPEPAKSSITITNGTLYVDPNNPDHLSDSPFTKPEPASVEPQVEPSKVSALDEYVDAETEKLRDSLHPHPPCSCDGDGLCWNCAAIQNTIRKVAADSVSHPPLEQVAAPSGESLPQEVRELFAECLGRITLLAKLVHVGQYHQWQQFEDCTQRDCKDRRDFINRAAAFCRERERKAR